MFGVLVADGMGQAGEVGTMLGKESVKVPLGLWGAFRRLGFVGRVLEERGVRDGGEC